MNKSEIRQKKKRRCQIMKKNTIIYLVAGMVALIIIGLSIYFAVAHNNTSDNRYDTKNITIEKYIFYV